MVRIAFVVAAVALAMAGAADAQSTADVVAQFGLIGKWATDCGQPTSDSNYLAVYAIKDGNVSRTYYDTADHAYNNYKIVSATRQGADMLSYTQTWDFEGKPADVAADKVEVVLEMKDGKFQIVSSQGSDGRYFVKDRKYPSSGKESPWQSKCQ